MNFDSFAEKRSKFLDPYQVPNGTVPYQSLVAYPDQEDVSGHRAVHSGDQAIYPRMMPGSALDRVGTDVYASRPPEVTGGSGFLSQPYSSAGARQAFYSGEPETPLRVIHVSTCAAQGGIEQWLHALIRFSDPNRMRFVRCISTGDYVDTNLVQRIGIPYEVGQCESIRRACHDCDVLLVSDPGQVGEWIRGVSRPVCVQIAHGDAHWTRTRLDDMQDVVDHVVAVSHHARDAVCGGYPTTVIPCGADTSRLATSRPRSEARSSLGFRDDDFVIGFVGRFSEEKNIPSLLRAVSLLPADFKLLLVGFGYLQQELMTAANELLPCRCVFTRVDENLGDVYGSMDAFCLPSFTEGFGLVTLEAMLCGLPVIATPVGLAADAFVDHVNGIVTDGEPESIRDVALRLKKHSDWAASVGREARKYADEFGHASTMAKQYEELLWSLHKQRIVTA